ncbi:MAG: AAA family ATPase [Myxococcales bacterium]|nr:AAA family ATPase [Myxococcales bacterium]
MDSTRAPDQLYRIVLTGGPGGGKTTAADLFRREIGSRVVLVPEAATIMFTGGFPRRREPDALRAVQTAIFHVQRGIEDVQSAAHPTRVLLCDRGTVDGSVYWPGPPEEFFDAMGTSLEQELSRYGAVVFFESAAAGGLEINSGNPARTESVEEARELDRLLRAQWSKHPRFFLVPHSQSFFEKISMGLAILQSLVAQMPSSPPPG